MPAFAADVQTTIDGPAYGQPLINRVRANRVNGRVRIFHSLYRAPASGTAPAIADTIVWGKLPVGARILGHMSRLDFSAGTASSTLNLGDNTLAARHLAATAITSAGSATPNVAVFSSTGLANVTLGSATVTNVRGIGAFGIGDIVTGTGIPTATFVVSVDKLAKTVTLSAVATATNSNVTLTAIGSAYETSDDSANITNAYTSTFDDCTLISTVAGAQVANNQVLSLHIAYTLD